MSTQKYIDSIPSALLSFQFLETVLKFYIRDCDSLIKESIKEKFCYSVRENEIGKMPLGQLINEFSRRSSRKDIIEVLKKLNKHRNYIAHTAYVLTEEESNNKEFMNELFNKLTKIISVTKECTKLIARELGRIKGEPISEELLAKL